MCLCSVRGGGEEGSRVPVHTGVYTGRLPWTQLLWVEVLSFLFWKTLELRGRGSGGGGGGSAVEIELSERESAVVCVLQLQDVLGGGCGQGLKAPDIEKVPIQFTPSEGPTHTYTHTHACRAGARQQTVQTGGDVGVAQA